ncbi:DUF1080 domain-containing protein [Spirosoma sp. KCTC 42546]|uniref:3-keto-disaccharide hydrolase n=1 Tax=Spirosoma sp. KCTC 42546 TaxID=2520506 RepID=UPI00115BBBC6|nr:DUF1080 domain-containing protein [Spirosoma sp. KCTC 42546]QDK82680.1 DUF1080 domain-containing protein [Spirosoma sp. KCTC 42546]
MSFINPIAKTWLAGFNLLLSTVHSQAIPLPTPFPAVVQQTKPNATSGWRQLFNGTDLTSWKHVGKGSMSVENGSIRGHGGMGLLYWTKEKFSNCTIKVVYRMQKENSNSGVYIRIPLEPREEWMPVHYGYEVQIDNHPETSKEDDTHITGTLYSLNKPLAKPGKPGPEWNTMKITLDGPRTIISVNGVKVTDYKEGDPVPARKFDFEPYRGIRPNAGYIGLQNHGEHDVVFFKEVSVKPLTKN